MSPRKPVPYTQRPPCGRCGGSGTVTIYDHKRQKHMVTECPSCGGSGKR
jgi:DnaJ-class molecular chaperone